jgi:Ca2+:H+ antiporter
VSRLLKPTLSWMLVFVPVAVGLHFARPEEHTWIFLASCAAVIPLAGWLGKATEHLAEHTGEGIGGLLNATFGNAAEMIIAFMALRRGLTEVVKASLTGSIIGNLLLVLGASFLAGGLRHPRQTFNVTGARSQATMLILAAVALVSPAAFHHLGGAEAVSREGRLSLDISIVLLVVYGLGLVFSLRTINCSSSRTFTKWLRARRISTRSKSGSRAGAPSPACRRSARRSAPPSWPA